MGTLHNLKRPFAPPFSLPKRRARTRLPLLTLGVALVSTLLTDLGALSAWCFDLAAIVDQQQWWRLISGHLVHSTGNHLLWDMIAFLVCAGYLECRSRVLLAVTLVAGICGVNLLLVSPLAEHSSYCGLSGVLFAPLAVAVILYGKANGQKHHGWLAWAPAFICAGKLVWELLTQQTLLVDSPWQPYPEAHLAGAMAGLLVYAGFSFLRRPGAKRTAIKQIKTYH